MDSKPPDREARDASLQKLMAIFKDICPEYLEEVAEKWDYCANDIAWDIADQEDSGFKYPRRKKKRDAERKQSEQGDVIQEMGLIRGRYDDDKREVPAEEKIQRMYQLLRKEFPHHSSEVVSEVTRRNSHSMFMAYLTLQDTTAPEQQEADGHGWIHTFPALDPNREVHVTSDVEEGIQAELQASRRYYAHREHLKRGQRLKEAERRNYQHAKDHGLLRECSCCFLEFPLNRMVSCEGEPNHLFCTKCPRKLAEEMIGQSRYQLQCLSVDGCSATFSLTERARFLDEGLVTALDRIEQDAVLRSANIEGLVACPFCSFAAICGPVEENREFPCQNPDCLVVSCRLCRSETHVPISCQEAAQKAGVSARHEIEEAMSAALIRKCNKCDTPFIKTLGCNKVSCTRCGNIQCDVCSENCDYTHFKENRPKTELVPQGCPLYDDAEHRYAREVDTAEKQTRERLVNEHPEIEAQYLNIPRPPPSKKRRRAAILELFEENGRQRHVPYNAIPLALQNIPEGTPQDGAQDGNEDDPHGGSQDDSQDGYEDGSQDGYAEYASDAASDIDSDVDSEQEPQDESQDESADEHEGPNKRQKREPNEAAGTRNPEMPRAPRPHLAVPNPVPARPANDLIQDQPQFNYPFGTINQHEIIPPWLRGQQQQQQQQQAMQQQACVQQQAIQQQQTNAQQQQANIQQHKQENQQQAAAQHLRVMQQNQSMMEQSMEQQRQANFRLMRARHYAQVQAQQLQRMQAQERAQQAHTGTLQRQQHALMQARRQEQLQLLMRAQSQIHQQGQQRAQRQIQLIQQLAQEETQRQAREQERRQINEELQQRAQEQAQQQAQEQARHQALEEIQRAALRQTIQQELSSPWEELEQTLLASHHESLRRLSQLGVPPLGLGGYQPLNHLGAQQQALAQHQPQQHIPQLQAQQQGSAEYGLGMPPAIAEEGDWRHHQHHGQ